MERNPTKLDWRQGLGARFGALAGLSLGVLFAATERLEGLREQLQGRRAPLAGAEPARLAFAAPRKERLREKLA